MGKLSSEERIKRVEQAPKEVQTMVAKAFLRDDIDDEDVQYLFNTDTIEEMNEPDVGITDVDAGKPEGIGAGNYFMRTWKPANNENFITRGWGGWSTCIKGSPMDETANVLANCVGNASGRFNECINEVRGTTGCPYPTLCCNAVDFKEAAEAAGLETGTTPRNGALLVWGKNPNGAGHVEFVERAYDNNHVFTSASNYGGTTWYNADRYNNNGRWGLVEVYYFRCFIYLPDDVQAVVDAAINPPAPKPEPTPTPTGLGLGDKVLVLNGYLTADSYGGGGKTLNYDGDTNPNDPANTKYITALNLGAPRPYHLSNGKEFGEDNIGWASKEQLKKL